MNVIEHLKQLGHNINNSGYYYQRLAAVPVDPSYEFVPVGTLFMEGDELFDGIWKPISEIEKGYPSQKPGHRIVHGDLVARRKTGLIAVPVM